MKADLVMWTKNGAKTLRPVLLRINEAIPSENINNKIIIDDCSTDNTREIASSFGWQPFPNEGKGISDGANTALRKVTTDFFVSFEQDIILSYDWWFKVPRLLNENTIIASGSRVPDSPMVLRDLEEYLLSRDRDRGFLIGKALDNTIYNTAALRMLGGFPTVVGGAGVDVVLAKKVADAGFSWKIAYEVKSVHIRSGIVKELKHQYWYGSCLTAINKKTMAEKSYFYIYLRTLFSPIQGIRAAMAKHNWQLAFLFPSMSAFYFLGVLKGMIKR
jgi:glycosyltransferase involved in cell wall biosynthesis